MDDTPPPPPEVPQPLPPPSGATPPAIFAVATVDERQMAMWCHLSSFAGYFIPMGNLLGPLVLWLTKRDTMPFVDQAGKEAVNFQISVTLYVLVSLVLMFACVGFFLLIAVAVFDIVFVILAALEASKGNLYKYPLCIRFIQ